MAAAPPRTDAPYPLLFGGIFVVSFATLLFELSMIRVFSFTIWHHFGYVVISTALLGFGASGSFLAVRHRFGTRHLRATLAGCSAAATIGVVGALVFVAFVPLNPMSILSERGQMFRLVAYQVVTTVPFFFSGLLVSLMLRTAAERVDRLYFWDLVGAGLGCALAVGIMNAITPPGATVMAGASFAAAAALFAPRTGGRLACAALAVVLAIAAPMADRLPFTPGKTKELALQYAQGYETYFTRWTALFRTDVTTRGEVDPRIPVPASEIRGPLPWGLSRTAPAGMERASFLVSHDATAGTGIFDLRTSATLSHLDYHILRLPYLVAPAAPRVLVIGVGGGRDIITAVQFGASHVTGAELDPVTAKFVRENVPVANGFFRQPKVDLRASEGRHFIQSTDREFDLIQITGVDTLAATSSGAYVLAENYLYTVEAVKDYLDHLAPDGVLSFAMANVRSDEPVSAGRMVVIAAQALRERGVERPEDHIAVVDSHALYAEVMVRPRAYTEVEVATLADRAAALQFAPLHLPGRRSHPVFDLLPALAGAERDAYLDTLRFVVNPTTDDRPFFQRYFRWGDLVQVDRDKRLIPNDASALGQIVLLILLASLTLLGAAFILLPLVFFSRAGIASGGAARNGVLVYFLAIGMGFMLFEISLIQRFVLFLGYPTYSLSVTLGSLLVSLGCGSYLSRRWVGRERTALPLAVAAIALLTVFYMKGLPPVQNAFLGSHIAVRCAVTAAVLAPLGLVMGIFFPLGIRRAAEIHEDLVPWAWGINGCASVTGGVLTVVTAMSFGFTVVWLISLAIYAVGVAAFLATSGAAPRTA